jgi:hypothetical protein
MSPGSVFADSAGKLEPRVLPLALVVLLEATIAYLILFETRCGEDECLDRPEVVTLASAVALAAALLVLKLKGRSRSETALRWLIALLWPIVALVVLWGLPFDVVFD